MEMKRTKKPFITCSADIELPSDRDAQRTAPEENDQSEPEQEDFTPQELSLTEETRAHIIRSAVSSLRAVYGENLGDTSVDIGAKLRELITQLFPCVKSSDRDYIVDELVDAVTQKRADDGLEKGLMSVADFIDDSEGELTIDQEGWNDKAVAAFNSLNPVLDMMAYSLPIARRGFQSAVGAMRNIVDLLLVDAEAAGQVQRASTFRLLKTLFDPRGQAIAGEEKAEDTLAARLAANSALVDKIFNSEQDQNQQLDFIIRSLLRAEDGSLRPAGAPIAAFLSFLRSLSSNGTRKSIMQLVSSAHECGTAYIDDVLAKGEKGRYRTGEKYVRADASTRGVVTVDMAAGAFLPLVGKTKKEIKDIEKRFTDAMKGVELLDPLSGEKGPEEFEKKFFKTIDVMGTDRTISVPDGLPRVRATREIRVYEHNAEEFSKVLDKTFGRGNMLSLVLRDRAMIDGIRNLLVNGGASHQVRLFLEITNAFKKNRNTGRIYALDMFLGLFKNFARNAGTEGLAREDLERAVVTAFSTGSLDTASVRFGQSGINSTSNWHNILALYDATRPKTVVRAKAPERGTRKEKRQSKSIAVCARGPIAAVLKYMTNDDLESPLSFKNMLLRISKETYSAEFWADVAIEEGNKAFNAATIRNRINKVQEQIAAVEAAQEEVAAAAGTGAGHEAVVASRLSTAITALWMNVDAVLTKKRRQQLVPDESTDSAEIAISYMQEALTAYEERKAEYVKQRFEQDGGLDGIYNRALSTMRWPDLAHTHIVARSLSTGNTPTDLSRAAFNSYQGEDVDKTSKGVTGSASFLGRKTKMWYMPLFGGDHNANNLIAFPTGIVPRPGELTKAGKQKFYAYNSAVIEIARLSGVKDMGHDAKRSAITSSDAPNTSLAGVSIEFRKNADGSYEPVITDVGECRIHLAVNLDKVDLGDGDTADVDKEVLHGQTIWTGFGGEMLRATSKNPDFRIVKPHVVGHGLDTLMLKSAATIVGGRGWTGTFFAPGSLPSDITEYLINQVAEQLGDDKNRAERSTDIYTDNDSYKIGPLTSKAYSLSSDLLVKNNLPMYIDSIAEYCRQLLAAGVSPEKIESTTVMVSRNGGPAEEKKLSDILPGFRILKVKGTKKTNTHFTLTYRDNAAYAAKVANIAHDAFPEPGGNGRNYTVDELVQAVTEAIVTGSVAPGSTSDKVIRSLTTYAAIGASIASHVDSVKDSLSEEPRLKKLLADGASVGDPAYMRLAGSILAKRIAKDVLSPVNRIDAVLVGCGATIDKATRKVVDTSASQMRRDVHKGSIVFADSETAPGALYEGFRRRLPLTEVNTQAVCFRYGMFMDEEAFAKTYTNGSMKDEDIAAAMETAVREIVGLDRREGTLYDKLHKLRNSRSSSANELRAVEKEYTIALSDRMAARSRFFGCFVDHHGDRITERFYNDSRGKLHLACEGYTLQDLLVKNGTKFDRSALYMGEDRVTLDTTDHSGKRNANCKIDGAKHIFLAGEAFHGPRTPSYNGTIPYMMRASFPVTEEPRANGMKWAPGKDALVAFDPFTLEILGCDNGGAKSELGFFKMTHALIDQVDLDAIDAGPAATTQEWVDKLLSAKQPLDGDYIVKRKSGKGYEVSKYFRNCLGNTLLMGMLDLAQNRNVPPGTERRQFSSPESTQVKPRPFDDPGKYWKRLVDVFPPDAFPNTEDLSNPEMQRIVTESAAKSAECRGRVVHSMGVLHLAMLSGMFDSREAYKLDPDSGAPMIDHGRHVMCENPNKIFSVDFTANPLKFQAFMRHVAGLADLTYDDLKERFCARLGLLPNMLDTIVIDILSKGVLPTTDDEWLAALSEYATSVREQKPDGTFEFVSSAAYEKAPREVKNAPKNKEKPKDKIGLVNEALAFKLDYRVDKSRLFMSKLNEAGKVEGGGMYRELVQKVLFGGRVDLAERKDAFIRNTLPMAYNKQKREWFYVGQVKNGRQEAVFNNLRGALGDRGLSELVDLVSYRGGMNETAAYLLYILGAAGGSLQAAADFATADKNEQDAAEASAVKTLKETGRWSPKDLMSAAELNAEIVNYLSYKDEDQNAEHKAFTKKRSDEINRVTAAMQQHAAKLAKYIEMRRRWRAAKDFAAAINYTKMDLGKEGALASYLRSTKTFERILEQSGARVDEEQRWRFNAVMRMRNVVDIGHGNVLAKYTTPEALADMAYDAVEEGRLPTVTTGPSSELYRAGYRKASEELSGVYQRVRRRLFFGGLVDGNDAYRVKDNAILVRNAVSMLRTLPKRGFTKDYDSISRTIAALSRKVYKEGDKEFSYQNPLEFRRNVEAILNVLATLMNSSTKAVKDPAMAYFSQFYNSDYTTKTDYDSARNVSGSLKQRDYGMDPGEPLRNIALAFALRDQRSLDMARADMAAVAETYNGAKRTQRYGANFTDAKSFVLSKENLADLTQELVNAMQGGAQRKGESEEAAAYRQDSAYKNIVKHTLYKQIKTVEALLDALGDGETPAVIKPSDVVTQFMPMYIAMTEPVKGAPSAESNSGSLLNLFPGLYAKWSEDAVKLQLVENSVATKFNVPTLLDKLSIVNFAPVDMLATRDKIRDAADEDGDPVGVYGHSSGFRSNEVEAAGKTALEDTVVGRFNLLTGGVPARTYPSDKNHDIDLTLGAADGTGRPLLVDVAELMDKLEEAAGIGAGDTLDALARNDKIYDRNRYMKYTGTELEAFERREKYFNEMRLAIAKELNESVPIDEPAPVAPPMDTAAAEPADEPADPGDTPAQVAEAVRDTVKDAIADTVASPWNTPAEKQRIVNDLDKAYRKRLDKIGARVADLFATGELFEQDKSSRSTPC